MANNKFNFYKLYLNDLNKLNPFQFKKVINALANYSDTEVLPDNLSSKGNMVFSKIMVVINTEKEFERELQKKKDAGYKGAQRRWKDLNSKNMAKTKHINSKNIAKSDVFE